MAGLRLIHCAIAEGAEVENTTTEGSFAGFTFTADHAPAYPKIYEFEAGIVVNDNNSTDTLTPRVRFGTDADVPGNNTAIWAGNATNVEDGDVGLVTGRITFQSATRAVFAVRASDVDAPATINPVDTVVLFASAAETAYRLDITGQWSVQHADNEAAAMYFNVWEAV
jgi:hypothetical protein